MSTIANGSIEMGSWTEEAFAEQEGTPKLTRAFGHDLYHGAIEGKASFEYLMIYRDDGVTSYVGLERVVGALNGREGSFVLRIQGAHQEGGVDASLSIEPGSGTGDLRGLRGAGTLTWQGNTGAVTLDYEFE